ncbi:MAG TPA: DMT family transporter [Candidatus Fermentibacter daniensis]|jgi:drug/metabolite transporter (DMT)-like permease|nr:DMT family transporter [Candidatus Fermentibacter daniensis]
MKFTGFKPGVPAALGAALLFGGGTPLAKLLLHGGNPWLLAGILYLGSGLGITLYRMVRRMHAGKLEHEEWRWFAGAILAGGVVGPVLLMFGLSGMPASGASLLLNTEGVFTALLAWFVFRENFDRRIAIGMIAIVSGAAVISWPEDAHFSAVLPALAVVGACLSWSIDNNLTCKVSHIDATWIASVKGLAAGGVNICIALVLGADWPPLPSMAGMLLVGCFSYGISLILFVVALRHVGTARTGAYFSIAPFFGMALAIPLLGEAVDARLIIAGTLMALGIWLHLTERHEHEHVHEAKEHEHEHAHDCHHQHEHGEGSQPVTNHNHRHYHAPLEHIHNHFPDTHHRHAH